MTDVDVLTVGAGPAGLMAALQAARRGLHTAVLERKKPCTKLLITGKGRCNLTNDCDPSELFDRFLHGGRFLRSAFSAFDNRDLCRFFETLGVPLKVERGGRVFPQSDRAADIAEALLCEVRRAGVRIETGRVKSVLTRDGKACGVLLENGRILSSRAVILAGGGKSYPATGSDGSACSLARALGHTVRQESPALVPIVCEGSLCAELQGLSLRNADLCAKRGRKTLFCERGELLFTHFGISGPLALTLSSVLCTTGIDGIELTVDLKPALDDERLDARILRDFAERSNREFRNALDGLLPAKLIPPMVTLTGIDPHKRVREVTAPERRKLAALLKALPLTPIRLRGFDEAIVTSGGVELKEVNPKTMESKQTANLFFAGEVLDIDAVTGGYNLTAAFSTGYAAGCHVLEDKR